MATALNLLWKLHFKHPFQRKCAGRLARLLRHRVARQPETEQLNDHEVVPYMQRCESELYTLRPRRANGWMLIRVTFNADDNCHQSVLLKSISTKCSIMQRPDHLRFYLSDCSGSFVYLSTCDSYCQVLIHSIMCIISRRRPKRSSATLKLRTTITTFDQHPLKFNDQCNLRALDLTIYGANKPISKPKTSFFVSMAVALMHLKLATKLVSDRRTRILHVELLPSLNSASVNKLQQDLLQVLLLERLGLQT